MPVRAKPRDVHGRPGVLPQRLRPGALDDQVPSMNSALPADVALETTCYHCGEDVPPGADYALEIRGVLRPMCCPGCRAVASLIADSGLDRFYDQRTAYSEKADDRVTEPADSFVIYDDPELLEQYSTRSDDGFREASLLIGGVSCAACTWLIETSLQRQEGITAVSLNLAQARLDLRFDPQQIRASEIFARVAGLGYRVQPWHASAERAQVAEEYRRDLRRLAVAGIGMMQVGMFAIGLHAGSIQGMATEYEQLLRLVSLLVTGFVVVFSARGFFESALRHLRIGALVMDLPVALAIGIAYGASAVATFSGDGDVYFDSVVMFTFLLLLARFIERRLRYRDSLAWRDAEQTLPDAVEVRVGTDWKRMPRKSLAAGQRVLVRAGDTIPIDGDVRAGASAVREDSFNGEAIPRSVKVGDKVYAGTINTTGSLEVLAQGSYAESRLAALQRSVDQARVDKPAVARMADRLASVFIAGVLLATAATALVWMQIDASRALWVALSVLVISCPCALSLATPAGLANASAQLRRSGVLVYGENALEALASSTHVLFDKTGTLTTSDFDLREVVVLGERSESEVLAIAAALQRHANHPIATAFTHPDADASSTVELAQVEYRVGAGVRGFHDGVEVRIGSLEFCRELCPALTAPPREPRVWIGLVDASSPLAWFGVVDELRPEAPATVTGLRAFGLHRELLTGDASPRAAQLAADLGFEERRIGQSPEDKLNRVSELQTEGAVVTMIGDGLNDAPVLQRADASIAVSGASDLARAQANFVIERGDLGQIPALYRTARRTRRVILQNFAWALGYNALGIPLAAMGLIPPWAAALGMSASSLIVVANASRLRRPPA